MDPDVSVIIPTRNRRDLLAEAVASVAAQTFTDWELIVVDDASDDGTAAWLATIHDDRLRTVTMPRNAERSVARTAGLAEARGRWVLYLDDDDLLEPHALATLHHAVRRHPDAVAAVGCVRAVGAARGRRGVRPLWPSRVEDGWLHLIAGWTPQIGAVLTARHVLDDIGEWRAYPLQQDVDYWLRVTYRGTVVVTPRVVHGYRQHHDQVRATPEGAYEEGRHLRETFIAELPPQDQQRAAAAMASWEAHREAVLAGRAHRPLHAALCAVRAARLAPWLLRSPIGVPRLVRPVLRSLAARPLRRTRRRSPRPSG